MYLILIGQSAGALPNLGCTFHWGGVNLPNLFEHLDFSLHSLLSKYNLTQRHLQIKYLHTITNTNPIVKSGSSVNECCRAHCHKYFIVAGSGPCFIKLYSAGVFVLYIAAFWSYIQLVIYVRPACVCWFMREADRLQRQTEELCICHGQVCCAKCPWPVANLSCVYVCACTQYVLPKLV